MASLARNSAAGALRLVLHPARHLALLALLGASGCALEPDPETLPAGHAYAGESATPAACAGHARADRAIADGTDGIRFTVRSPVNYDPARAHPLIVVYAAAAQTPASSERFTRLTRLATGRGFLVAYVQSRPLSLPVLRELGEVPGRVAAQWCVDPERVFLLGHSDGGTASAALTFLPGTALRPRAIAASAPGLRADDLAAYACPDTLPVMIVQKRDDTLFPGYAAELAAWYAACNGCIGQTEPLGAHCSRYTGCRNDIPTVFCERDGGHRAWPDMNATLLDFFARTGGR